MTPRTRGKGRGTGRFWVAFWLALFLAVAMAVVARQQAALTTARELGRLRTQRAGLEARKAGLERQITMSSTAEALLPKVARLGLALPADTSLTTLVIGEPAPGRAP